MSEAEGQALQILAEKSKGGIPFGNPAFMGANREPASVSPASSQLRATRLPGLGVRTYARNVLEVLQLCQ